MVDHDLRHQGQEFTAHPEGLTQSQEYLMDFLLTRPNPALAEIGLLGPDGKFQTVKPGSAIAVAPEGTGFRFVHHQEYPGAPYAPIKVNMRELEESTLHRNAVVLAELGEKTGFKADLVTGLPNAGVPLARAFAAYTGIEYVDIFDKVQTENERHLILKDAEAKFPGQKLLMIDDLIDQGVTKEFAFKLAKLLGCDAVSLFVTFNRGEGGVEFLRSLGYDVNFAIELDDGLKYGMRKGNFSREVYDAHIAYGHATRSYIAAARESRGQQ